MREAVNSTKMKWMNEPTYSIIQEDKIIVETEPFTDLWGMTAHTVKKNNAHMLTLPLEKDFMFDVRVDFSYKKKYDQAGIVIYVNADNWFKCSVEYRDRVVSDVACAVTYHGFSDRSSREIGSGINYMYFRIYHHLEDFMVENSFDGIHYKEMRMFHLKNREGKFKVGVFAASPNDSSFDCTFSNMYIDDCRWDTSVYKAEGDK